MQNEASIKSPKDSHNSKMHKEHFIFFIKHQTRPLTHISVITANHLSIGDLVAQAVCWLVRVHWHVQHIWGVDIAEIHSWRGELRSVQGKVVSFFVKSLLYLSIERLLDVA